MTQPWQPETSHERAVMEVLQAIRAFTDAMDRMHNGMKSDMTMNATDLAALRMLIMREQRDELVRPQDVAEHLRITTASTTKLLDRLAASGHIERQPHPHDRRARILVLTQETRDAFYRHFGERMRQMRAVASDYSESELAVITRFLAETGDAVS